MSSLLRQTLDVPAPDGTADAYLVRPSGGGPHPAVLVFMDGIGLRPRMQEMADRLAEEGYAVLVPNGFYRAGRAPVLPDLVERLNSEERASVFGEIMPLIQSLTPDVAQRDTAAWVAFLEAQPDVDAQRIGVVGYCMGGALALRAAAQFPDRVRAAASFHGGNLAPEGGTGADAVAGRITAEVLLAHADEDPSAPPEQVARIEQALTDAGVVFRSDVYAGAHHGFTMSDMPVHDAAAEQRHWDALLDLFRRTLPV